MLESMTAAGTELATAPIGNAEYMAAERAAIPASCRVAGETPHPNSLIANFALVRDGGELVPRLVDIQAFPSVYGYQAVLSDAYREIFGPQHELGHFLGGLDAEES